MRQKARPSGCPCRSAICVRRAAGWGTVALPLRLLPADRGDSSRTRVSRPTSTRRSVPHARRDTSRQAGHPLPRAALRIGRRSRLKGRRETKLDVTPGVKVHDGSRKPFHFSLLDADKLHPNRLIHNESNHCSFNLKQRLTVRLKDPETQKLATGNRGGSLYRATQSRQVDHGSLT